MITLLSNHVCNLQWTGCKAEIRAQAEDRPRFPAYDSRLPENAQYLRRRSTQTQATPMPSSEAAAETLKVNMGPASLHR